MTYAVRYYTKTGNTKRLAEAMAKELGVEALPISEPVNERVDYLFLGNSYYAFNYLTTGKLLSHHIAVSVCG